MSELPKPPREGEDPVEESTETSPVDESTGASRSSTLSRRAIMGGVAAAAVGVPAFALKSKVLNAVKAQVHLEKDHLAGKYSKGGTYSKWNYTKDDTYTKGSSLVGLQSNP